MAGYQTIFKDRFVECAENTVVAVYSVYAIWTEVT